MSRSFDLETALGMFLSSLLSTLHLRAAALIVYASAEGEPPMVLSSPPQLRRPDVRNALTLPRALGPWTRFDLKAGHQPIGRLAVAPRSPTQRSPAVDTIRRIAPDLGSLIWNLREHDALKRQQHELDALFEIGSEISSLAGLDSVLQLIVDRARRILRTDLAYLALLDENENSLKMRAFSGERSEALRDLEIPVGTGVGGRAITSPDPILVEDYRTHPWRVPAFVERIEPEGIRSVMAIPLVAGDTRVGVLFASNRYPSWFTKDQVRQLRSLANQAAIAALSARLLEREHSVVEALQTVNVRLEDALTANERMVHSMLEEGSVPDLIQVVHNFLGRPVAFEDHRGVVHTAPASISAEDIDPSGTHDVSISAFGEGLGTLRILSSDALTPEETIVVQQATTVIALALTQEQRVLEVERRLKADFVLDLLQGKLTDAADSVRRAAFLGYELQRVHAVFVIDIETERESSALIETPTAPHRWLLHDAVLRAVPRALVSVHGESAVALVPATDGELDDVRVAAEAIHRNLEGHLDDAHVFIGVGNVAARLDDLPRSWAQAQQALQIGRALRGTSPKFFADLGIYRLLTSRTEARALTSYAAEYLQPLLEYDRQHGSALVDTLKAFLECDRNLRRTAEALYVHPNTARYRMARIREISGIDLRSASGCFEAHLAVKVLDVARRLEDGEPRRAETESPRIAFSS